MDRFWWPLGTKILNNITQCAGSVSLVLILLLIDKKTKFTSRRRHGLTDPGGLHELGPVSVPDGRVLQFADGSQRRDHVLDGVLGSVVRVPRARLLVQHAQVLRELLALLVHELDVDLAPRRDLPVVNRRLDDGDVVPERLDHAQLASTRFQLFEVGHDHLEQRRRLDHSGHLVLHFNDLRIFLHVAYSYMYSRNADIYSNK